MAGHEVGDKVLIHPILLVQGEILVHKFVVHGVPGLAHPGKNRIGNVLRGNLQLAGNVVLHQLLEEGILLVREQIVKADAAADEYLLNPGKFAQLAKQGHIVAVIGVHIFARGGVEALTAAAGALGQLLFASRVPEVGGGSPNIVDITFEIRVLHHLLRFPEDGFVAAGLDDPALVEGQGAERTGPEAAPVADQAEFDLLNGGNTPGFFIAGVVGAAVGKVVYFVHFLGGQGLLRRVLHHIEIPTGLGQPFGSEGVAVSVLDAKALGVASFVRLHFFIGRQENGGQALVRPGGFVDGAVDVGDVFHVHAGVQSIRDFHNALFSHAVHEQVRLGIQENGAF